MPQNRDTTAARAAQLGAAAKARQIELLDARELRQLLAYLIRGATFDQLEELLESDRWRQPAPLSTPRIRDRGVTVSHDLRE